MAKPIRSKTFLPKIVSANDLLDGDVVYADAQGGWTRRLADAAIADSPEAAEALLARALTQPGVAVGPALADVEREGLGPRPLHYREATRARGPSNRPDLGRQAEIL